MCIRDRRSGHARLHQLAVPLCRSWIRASQSLHRRGVTTDSSIGLLRRSAAVESRNAKSLHPRA
eukprot:11148670-Alexandrium_andersonii.AAC.1